MVPFILTTTEPRPVESAVLCRQRVLDIGFRSEVGHLHPLVVIQEFRGRIEGRIRRPTDAGDVLSTSGLKQLAQRVYGFPGINVAIRVGDLWVEI